MRKLGLCFLYVFIPVVTSAQEFVGEVSYRDQFQYLKISCEEGGCNLSLPYLDGREECPLPFDSPFDKSWEVDRGTEIWNFETNDEKGSLEGTLKTPNGSQQFILYEQLNAIPETDLAKYSGSFEDETGNRVVVYQRRNYLHLMSPYAEQTVSLKPIDERAFWSVSGEKSYFDNLHEGEFIKMVLVEREGKKHHLKRVDDFIVEEHWINVFGDSIFAKLFIPPSNTKVPACLLLPGGGGMSQMENFEYEARFFASNGMAAMIFDKSGVGNSGGQSFENFTFEEKAKRYQEIFHYLAKLELVNAQKVGLHGPSEGGRLSLMMASNIPDSIAFVNATAAPLMSMQEGQLYAVAHHHRNMGVPEADNLLIQNIWNRYYRGIMDSNIDSSDFTLIRNLRNQNERLFLPPTSTVIPISPKSDDLKNDRVVQDAAKIKCPVLLQYGENDQRVDPYNSLRNFYSNLAENHRVETIIYNRGNHSMMTPEYQICTGYADDKLKWLKKIKIL